MKKTTRYAYNTIHDDGIYRGDAESKEEAIKEAEEDIEIGDKYFVGRIEEFEFDDIYQMASNLCENMMESAMDEVGEVADDWFDADDEKDITNYVAKYIWKKYKPGFTKVEDVETFTKKQPL